MQSCPPLFPMEVWTNVLPRQIWYLEARREEVHVSFWSVVCRPDAAGSLAGWRFLAFEIVSKPLWWNDL